MTYTLETPVRDYETIAEMPSWVISARAETIEDGAFLSGAALAHLHMVLALDVVPLPLLRDRLPLRAAEVCVAFSGRSERAGELRDVMHLLRPGDLPIPAGGSYLSWRPAVERPVSMRAPDRALPNNAAEQIRGWLDAGQGAPMARTDAVLEQS